MVNWSYPYVYARARGILSTILSPSQVGDALRSDITTFLQLLLTTSYSDIAANFSGSEFSIVDFEHAAKEKMLKRLYATCIGVPPEVKSLVNIEFKKFEGLNIKQALRVLHLVETEEAEVPEELKKFFIPLFYPREYYENMLELGSIARAIEVIRDVRLKNALTSVYEDYKRAGELSILESTIDTLIYSDLRNLLKYGSAGPWADRFQIYRLVSEGIDLLNMSIMMRCLLAGMDFSDHLIPANFALGDDFCSILASETVTEILAILGRSSYKDIVDQIVSGDERDALFEFESLSKRYIAKMTKSLFYISPLSIMSVYGFLEIELYEIQDIMTIFVGKLNELDPEDIKSNLILLGFDGK